MVLDTSSSMGYKTGGWYSDTRMEVAADAVNSLAEQLLQNNTAEHPDTVTMSLITFDNYAMTRVDKTTSLATFTSKVPTQVQRDRGTNWEDALNKANGLQTRSGAQTYVIFVSDGDPTLRATRGSGYGSEFSRSSERDAYGMTHVYYGSGNSDNNGLNYQYAATMAGIIGGSGKAFYSIGAFGTVSRMQNLAAAAGQSDNYFSASDGEALEEAFSSIIGTITHQFSYSKVKINDGLTSLTASTVLSGTASDFTYTKTAGGVTSTWTDAPAATCSGSSVTWDLSSAGALEDGVTYTVSFTVWPSQEALDVVAQLKNGTLTLEQANQKYGGQFVQTADGGYGLKTNTAATVDYTAERTTTASDLPDDAVKQDDGTWYSPSTGYTYTYNENTGKYEGKNSAEGTSAFDEPNPLELDAAAVTVAKTWVDSINNATERPSGDIGIDVMLDGTTTLAHVTLNEANGYSTQVYVPYGIKVGGEALSAGHAVTLVETTTDSHYEFVTETITPMLVDGTLVLGGDGDSTLTGANKLKGIIEITKSAVSADGTYPDDATFEFTVTVTTPDGAAVPYTVQRADGTAAQMGTLASGQAGTISIAPGQKIVIEEAAVGTTYAVDETASPAGWSFATVTDSAPATIQGSAVSGTIANGNSKVTIAYANTYKPEYSSPTGEGNLTITKTLDGRALEAGQFSFTLAPAAGSDAPAFDTPTVTNALDGSVSFGTVKFTKAGTYRYTLSETAADAQGYSYDSATYTLVAQVTANPTTNALDVAWSIEGSTERAITFANTYKASGQTTLSATKTLTGRAMNAGEFSFVVKNAKGATVAQATNPAAGDGVAASLDFGTFTYTNAQVAADLASGVAQQYPATTGIGAVYRYYVSEDTTGLAAKGVTPVVSSFTVDVVVVDKGDGTMSATVNYPQDANGTLAFKNSYQAAELQLEISGSKQLVVPDGLNGPGDIGGKYTFAIASDDENAPLPDRKQATNGAGGSVDFGPITFGAAGTYVYTITESGSVPGVTNDPDAEKTVTVKVTDDGQGHLSAEIVGDESGDVQTGAFKFVNTYKADPVATTGQAAITVAKVVQHDAAFSPEVVDGQFLFTLQPVTAGAPTAADATVALPQSGSYADAFAPITFTAPGQYVYRIVETANPDVEGNTSIAFDAAAATGKLVVVTVTDNGKGALEAQVAGADATATEPSNQTTFTNSYEPTPAVLAGDTALRVTKAVRGHSAADGFTFKLTQATSDATRALMAEEDATVATGSMDDGADSTLAFGSVGFVKPGTYHFTITEEGTDGDGWTCDDRTHDVVVTVVDNGQGKLVVDSVEGDNPTVTNTYAAAPVMLSGETALSLTKEVFGSSTDQVFRFTLDPQFDVTAGGITYAQGALDAQTTGTLVEGAPQAVSFGAITFTKAGTYAFTMSEAEGKAGGWTYDTTDAAVTVTVADNGKGQLVALVAGNAPAFENYYKARGSFAIAATKTLDGRAMKAGEFSFTITDGAGDTVATAVNKAAPDGEASALDFGSISYQSTTFADDVAAGRAVANADGSYTYAYTATEAANLPTGVTAATASQTFTVTVKDNGNGKLTATPAYPNGAAGLTFANSYTASTPIGTRIAATKTLTGRDMNEGEFSFVVKDARGTTVATGSNQAAAAGAAAPVDFTYNGSATGLMYTLEQVKKDVKAGIATAGPDASTYSYQYTVSEDVSALPKSVTAVDSSFTVTVRVTDQGNGMLTTEVQYPEAANAVAFANAYDAVDAKLAISGTKRLEVPDGLTGPGDIAGKYTFAIAAVTHGAPLPSTTTTTNETGGDVRFGDITFDTAGEYTYKITESGQVDGVANDSETTKNVTVRVTDEGGYLVAAVVNADGTAVTGSAFTFVNTYGASDKTLGGDEALRVTKKLDGRALAANEFSFTLSAQEATAPLPKETTVSNAADGSVVFGDITYTAADAGKTYHYTVAEQQGDLGGVTYDTTPRTITVAVSDAGNGTLKLDVTDNNPTVTNVYATNVASISLTAHKVLAGPQLRDGQFTFTLVTPGGETINATNNADGSVALGTFQYSLADLQGAAQKTFTYTVSEVNDGLPGYTYDTATHTIDVTLADDGQGTLTATATGNDPTFKNSYTAKPVTLTGDTALAVTKKVEGFASSEPYTFNLSLTSGDATAVTMAGTQATTPSSLADGAQTTVSFGDVTFSKAGTYTFTVWETAGTKAGWTYDASQHLITVNVKDGGAGQLEASVKDNNPTFTNTYKAASTDPVVITANKQLTDAQLMAGEFSFKLTDGTGATVGQASNAKDGTVAFDGLTFDKPGTYTYTMSETVGLNSAITYDRTTYPVTVTVTDPGTGKLQATVTGSGATFHNTYKAASGDLVLTAQKVLNGRTLEASQFQFQLYDEKGAEVGTAVTNDAAGSITFPKLSYTEKDFEGIAPAADGTRTKTVTYTARELLGKLSGYQYDTSTVATYPVKIVDDGKGTITATVVDPTNTTFTNGYTATPTTAAAIVAHKSLSGRSMAAGEFSFQLSDETGNVIQTAQNDANGTVTFKPITYKLADLAGSASKTFTYAVRELAGDAGGVAYDEHAFTVSVTVSDNGDGTLSASTLEYDGAATFENTYEPSAVTVPLPQVNKEVAGDKTTDYPTFAFTLTAEGAAPLPAGAQDGAVTKTVAGPTGEAGLSFGSVTFGAAETYTYTVRETAGDAEDWTYDPTVYTVTYVVKDTGQGTLDVERTITANGKAAEALSFTNTYDEPVVPVPEPEPEPTVPEPEPTPAPAATSQTASAPKQMAKTADNVGMAAPVALAAIAGAAGAVAFGARRKMKRH
ncbi:MAG: FctA domain-containing protein [Eggerthellaceae bacterium]